MWEHDHVLGVRVRRLRGVAEVRCGLDCLGPDRVAACRRRRCGRGVLPHACQPAAAGISNMLGVGRRARLRARRNPVAVLSHDARPRLSAGPDAREEGLEVRGDSARVTGEGLIARPVRALRTPLRAPEHEGDLLCTGGDPRAGGRALELQVAGRRGRDLRSAGDLRMPAERHRSMAVGMSLQIGRLGGLGGRRRKQCDCHRAQRHAEPGRRRPATRHPLFIRSSLGRMIGPGGVSYHDRRSGERSVHQACRFEAVASSPPRR